MTCKRLCDCEPDSRGAKCGDPVGLAPRHGGKRNSLCIVSLGFGDAGTRDSILGQVTLGRRIPTGKRHISGYLHLQRLSHNSSKPRPCASSYSSSIQAKAREARTAALATTRAKPKRRRARPRHRGLDRQGACASERAARHAGRGALSAPREARGARGVPMGVPGQSGRV